MGFFSFGKKMSFVEVRTKLRIKIAKLKKQMSDVEHNMDRKKAEAKTALKKHDERRANRLLREIAYKRRQKDMLDGMYDTVCQMKTVIEIGEDSKDIADTNKDITQMARYIGVDTKDMEKAMSGLAEVTQRTVGAIETMSNTMNATMADDSAISEEQESLKQELLAEIEGDTEEVSELESDIKRQKKKEYA